MSKIFFDQLIDLGDVEKEIKLVSSTEEEKMELWDLVDEILHHRVMGCIFGNLPHEHHSDFLEKFNIAPYDEGLIDYLVEKTEDIEEKIKMEVEDLKGELLELVRGK